MDGKSRGEGRRAGVGGRRGGTSHVRRNVGGSGRVEAGGGRSSVVDRHVACGTGKTIKEGIKNKVSGLFSLISVLGILVGAIGVAKQVRPQRACRNAKNHATLTELLLKTSSAVLSSVRTVINRSRHICR